MIARIPYVAPLLVFLCALGCQKSAPPPTPRPPPEVTAPQEPEPAPQRHRTAVWSRVQIVVRDTTKPDERPAPFPQKALHAAAVKAASLAGFAIDPKSPNLLGVEVWYGLTDHGKLTPNAPKGLLSWAAQASLRVKDKDGLGETFEGMWKDERPLLRAAVPDLSQGLAQLLQETMGIAFRDIVGQITFRHAGLALCQKALGSDHPVEVWAALQRLGELQDPTAIPAVIRTLLTTDSAHTVAIAAGVLGRLHSPKALDALAQIAALEEPAKALVATDAIAQIGGAKARALLQQLADTHPLKVIKQAATEHLRETAAP